MTDCIKRKECNKIVGNPYEWQNPCPCKEYEKEKDKYRWHDLRKNPYDLPEFVTTTMYHEFSEAVEVVTDEKVYDVAIYTADRMNEYSSEHIREYFAFGDDGVLDGVMWDGMMRNENIIAWRYIEPFEFEEEYE